MMGNMISRQYERLAIMVDLIIEKGEGEIPIVDMLKEVVAENDQDEEIAIRQMRNSLCKK
jgi:hypothetical protein